jgi:hypothetical protein
VAQLAFRGALLDVSGSTRRISGELSRLKASGRGLAGGNGVFVPFIDAGAEQLRWIDAERDPESRRETDGVLRHSDEFHPVERTMSGEHAWQGNWVVRLYERVRERGYDSLTAFADARPTASLVALARELGRDDVAGVQVLRGLLAEAERRKQVTRFVRDVFVRLWSEEVPDGWPVVMDDANRVKVAMALGPWIAYTPETHKERARQTRTALLATPPPPGWRPLGPDDELLRTLLPDEEA